MSSRVRSSGDSEIAAIKKRRAFALADQDQRRAGEDAEHARDPAGRYPLAQEQHRDRERGHHPGLAQCRERRGGAERDLAGVRRGNGREKRTMNMLDVDAIRAQVRALDFTRGTPRSEEHTSELQSLMRISYDVF